MPTRKLRGSSLCHTPHFSHLYSPIFVSLSPQQSLSLLSPLSPITFQIIISLSLSPSSQQTMKLLTNINPKKIFRSKKSRSISRSDPTSFSSGTSSSSDSSDLDLTKSKSNGLATPTSVLPGEWSQLTPQINLELIQAFKIIDRDDDGKITKSELRALLSRLGAEPPCDEEINLMLSEIDNDGDSSSDSGSISVEKFGAISEAFEPPPCHDELRETFHFFDADHDGKITAEELFRFFTSIGDGRCTLEDCRRMIRGVDKNGDGYVCFEDFTLMMQQQR